jgi:hypothetical protein
MSITYERTRGALRNATVTCDALGCTAQVIIPDLDPGTPRSWPGNDQRADGNLAAVIRAHLRGRGWDTRGGYDYCPDVATDDIVGTGAAVVADDADTAEATTRRAIETAELDRMVDEDVAFIAAIEAASASFIDDDGVEIGVDDLTAVLGEIAEPDADFDISDVTPPLDDEDL